MVWNALQSLFRCTLSHSKSIQRVMIAQENWNHFDTAVMENAFLYIFGGTRRTNARLHSKYISLHCLAGSQLSLGIPLNPGNLSSFSTHTQTYTLTLIHLFSVFPFRSFRLQLLM